MKEQKNWAYGVSINGAGTIFYGREYFARETSYDKSRG